MAEIRWTEEAHRWLKDIFDYIAADDPKAAQQVVTGIHEKAQLLRRFPEIGYKYRTDFEGDVRILLYGHYRIAYLVTASSDNVTVLGVFHGALDIDRYLP